MNSLILFLSGILDLFLVIITAQNTIKRVFCIHTIGVALKSRLVEKYASVLSKCQERTVAPLASQNINPSKVSRKVSQGIRNFMKGSPKKRFRKNRSNFTEHSQRFVSDQNSFHSTLLFQAELLLRLRFQHCKLNCMEEHFC